jgi:hypothetical protein
VGAPNAAGDRWETIVTVENNKGVQITPEGVVKLEIQPDGSMRASSDQPVKMDLGTIRSVGIRNLVHVESHAITRVAGSVSHYVRFFGGGALRFAYNDRGQLIELVCELLSVTTQDGEVLVDVQRRVD